VVWTFAPKPPRVGTSQWTVSLKGADGKPVQGARISLEGNMSHPGMQPVQARLQEAAPGQYKAPLKFTMEGDWFILMDATLKDGSTLHQQWSVPAVSQ
jgi:hypothetical protein